MGNSIERAALGWANLGGYACAKPLTSAEQKAVFERAHQLGVRMHDTAIDYGRGFAEEGLGHAWTEMEIPREEMRIQSKVLRRIVVQEGVQQYREAGLWRCPAPYAGLVTKWDWSYDGVIRQAEESRMRLRTEYHDGLALHDPAEAVAEAGLQLSDLGKTAIAALRDLQQQGRVREIGVGTKEIPVLAELVRLYPGVFHYFMTMNYNLLDHHRCIDELIPLCAEQGIRLFMAGPYASGILAGSLQNVDPTFYYRRAAPEMIGKVQRLTRLASHFGMTSLRPAAVQFVAANDAFSKIVFGGRSPDEIEENLSNPTQPIPLEFWSRLREETIEGAPLIHPRAPLPFVHP